MSAPLPGSCRYKQALPAIIGFHCLCLFQGAGIAAQSRLPENAATYPTKPIRFVVGFTPGGGTDVIARLMGQKLTGAWGQPVVVDNRTGAGGRVANETVARALPDGYTVLMVSASFAIHPSIYRSLPYDSLKDFAPVSITGSAPKVLVVPVSLPVNSVKELVALAKAKPGQLNYASAGNGSTLHLSAELFKSVAGVDIVHVPYKGATGLTDLIAGSVQLSFAGVAQSLGPVKAKRLRALAVTGSHRSPELPDVPTVAEAGVPNYEVTDWYGMLAPAGTSAAIVRKLSGEIVGMMRQQDMRERMAAQGLEAQGSTPEELAALIAREIPKWAGVIKAIGLKPE